MDPSTTITTAPAPTPAPPVPNPPPSKRPPRGVLHWVAVGLLVTLILLGLLRAGIEGYAGYHSYKADKYLAKQNYVEAQKHLEAVLKVRPQSAALHLRLGRVYRQQDLLDKAMDQYHIARELQGQTEEYQLEMLMRKAQTTNFEEVYDNLWVYVATDKPEAPRPEAPLVLESLALAAMTEGVPPMALGMVDRWLEKQPDNVAALYMKAKIVMQLGSLDDAVAALEKALARDPEREDIQQLRGIFLAELHRYDDAIAIHRQYLQKHPNDPMSLLYLARCLYNKGEANEAQEVLVQAQVEGEGVPDLWAERGKMLLLMGDPKAAEPWLRKALEADPNLQLANYQLAICVRRLGRVAEAERLDEINRQRDKDNLEMAMLSKKLATDDSAELFGKLGALYLRMGRENGIFWIYKAIKKDSTNPSFHEILVDFWERHNKADSALTSYQFLSAYWVEHKQPDKALHPSEFLSDFWLRMREPAKGSAANEFLVWYYSTKQKDDAKVKLYRDRLPQTLREMKLERLITELNERFENGGN
jgi:tetratricopeptide (TPR) repeat protein